MIKRKGEPLGAKANAWGLLGTVEDVDPVEEVIPGNDIENIGYSPGIWSVEPFVNSVVGDLKLERRTQRTNGGV